MNTLLVLAYNGAAYHGFQVQQNALTVCEVLQNALQAVLAARPDVKGCSRTDAGVHARQFCASFKYTPAHTGAPQPTAPPRALPPLEKLPLALNAHLPADIRVQRALPVADDFHARYAAVGKEYEYVWRQSAVDDPFTMGQYYRVAPPLDIPAMQAAAALFVGRHNFAAFSSANGGAKSPVRTVFASRVEQNGPRVSFTITADGFLYNMVRILAGTLLAVGAGRMGQAQVAAALESGSRRLAGDTLPPCGLFLNRVFYPPEKVPGFEAPFALT